MYFTICKIHNENLLSMDSPGKDPLQWVAISYSRVKKKKKKIKPTLKVNVAQLCLTLYDPMGFSRQEYWSL